MNERLPTSRDAFPTRKRARPVSRDASHTNKGSRPTESDSIPTRRARLPNQSDSFAMVKDACPTTEGSLPIEKHSRYDVSEAFPMENGCFTMRRESLRVRNASFGARAHRIAVGDTRTGRALCSSSRALSASSGAARNDAMIAENGRRPLRYDGTPPCARSGPTHLLSLRRPPPRRPPTVAPLAWLCCSQVSSSRAAGARAPRRPRQLSRRPSKSPPAPPERCLAAGHVTPSRSTTCSRSTASPTPRSRRTASS